MTVPYTFGTATTSIPLSNLDANFNTPITLGNTSIYLGNTTTTIGNLTLTNATISSGNVTLTNVSVTTANVTNITVSGTANIATGNVTTLTSTSITDSGLTSGRVTFAGASGLLSDSANLFWDNTNARLGIGTSSPDAILDVTRSGNGQIAVLQTSASRGFSFDSQSDTALQIASIQGSTNMDLWANTLSFSAGATERMRITSAGNVGIGTSSPDSYATGAKNLVIASSGDSGMTIRSGTTSTGVISFANAENSTSNNGIFEFNHNDLAMNFNIYGTGRSYRFKSAGTEVLRIDSSGNVGIGTSSPTTQLEVKSVAFTDSEITLDNTSSNTTSRVLFKAAGTEYGRVSGDSTSVILQSGNIPIVFRTNSAERMRLDSAGNLGLGVTPSAFASGQVVLQNKGGYLGAGSTNELYLSQNVFYGGSPAADRYVNTDFASSFGQTSGAFTWRTAASGTAGNAITFTQAMTLTASGNLLVGTTSSSFGGRVIVSNDGTTTQTSLSCINTNGSGTMRQIDFFTGTNTSRIGSIESTTTTTAFNTSSDYRLKENITPMTGALAKVAQLKPVTYKWKSDGSDGQGFIAHELQAVVPDCVSGEKDAVDAQGNPDYQGVDTSFLVATLVSAIQEQQALIESLTTRLTALENK